VVPLHRRTTADSYSLVRLSTGDTFRTARTIAVPFTVFN
jgi:hypothetical protein